MKKIRLHPELMRLIATEFDVSIQTVRMSLNYVFNSEKSKSIRERAKYLLQIEADKPVELKEQASNQ